MRKNCQYLVHSAVRNTQVRRRQLAVKKGSLTYPRSNKRPMTRPGRKIRAYYHVRVKQSAMPKVEDMEYLNRSYPCTVKYVNQTS